LEASVSDLSPETRALFRGARADLEPTNGDRTRVGHALAVTLGAGAGLAASAGAASGSTPPMGIAGAASGGASSGAGAVSGAASALAAGAKWLAAAAVVTGLTAGGVSMYAGRSPKPAALPQTASPSSQTSTAQATSSPQEKDGAGHAATPPATAPPRRPTRAPQLAPIGLPPQTRASAAATAPLTSMSAPPPLDAAPTATAAAAEAPTTTIGVAPPPVNPAPRATLGEEARLIREANAALRDGDATRALTLADAHARAYPSGVLAEERAVLRVFALCKLGRITEARSDGARFVATYPGSAHVPRVRATCVDR
jgi:hypothetical protein